MQKRQIEIDLDEFFNLHLVISICSCWRTENGLK